MFSFFNGNCCHIFVFEGSLALGYEKDLMIFLFNCLLPTCLLRVVDAHAVLLMMLIHLESC